jgi:hypothetical protein
MFGEGGRAVQKFFLPLGYPQQPRKALGIHFTLGHERFTKGKTISIYLEDATVQAALSLVQRCCERHFTTPVAYYGSVVWSSHLLQASKLTKEAINGKPQLFSPSLSLT